jgi:hypothetical protein
LDGNLFSILIGSRKDEEAIDWSKGFQNFHWTRGTSSRKVMEAYQRGGFFLELYVEKKKKGRGSVRNLLVLMCVRITHGKDVCKNQTWKESVCSKYL